MKFDFEKFLVITRKIDDEIRARCPFHDDSRPSFSANAETGLWMCHAGCGQGNFAQFLQMVNGDPQARIRRSRGGNSTIYAKDEGFRTVATYQYMDKSGSYHLRVTRQEKPSGEKRFFQEHVDFAGNWKKGGAINDLIPYLMHEWSRSSSPVVFFVEGEKCADFLFANGLNATTTPGGANKWKPHYANYFTGKQVIVLPDEDDVGRKFAHDVHRSLYLQKIAVSIVYLPDLNEGEDVIDWLSQNRTIQDLLKLLPYMV